MKKNVKKVSREYVVLLVGIFLGIGFLLLDSIGAISFVRTGISFIMDPIAYQGDQAGNSLHEYFETFVKLDDFREEYNELSIKIYEQEVDTAFYAILKEENESLKKQIALGNLEQNYVMTKVIGRVESDTLRVNKGEKDGVTMGDTVVLGNMYVGTIVRVDRSGSLVRLPFNSASNLEVVVVSGQVEKIRLLDSVVVLTKGVARGSSEGIKIENMSMNVSLENGNTVVVNDPRVGEYLVLGQLVGLSENPAATSRSGYVSPILDYDRLVTLFIKTDF